MENQSSKWVFRMTPIRFLLLILTLIAVALATYRLIVGLGPTTNLNDEWPWGLWIGFDVLTGVALAGGGYSVALIAHILHIEKFNVIARSAMLTSLLGYLLVMVGLFLDIGQWFNFWRPFVSWGYHSVLFEVFWCVSLYTTVQVLEFGEIGTEKVAKPWHNFFVKAMPFLLVIGVLLPTLHQSSLGALYLTQVDKLHPLWWSPYIGLFFLMSSFFVGPAMVTVETSLAGRAWNHWIDVKIIRSLQRIGVTIMLMYLTLKIWDLIARDAMQYVFAGGLESTMFLIEMGFGIIIPILIFFSPWGKTRAGLVTAGALVALGVILNRMNVVIIGMIGYYGPGYFPSTIEILVTVGLVAGGMLAYCFICDNFRILDHHDDHSKAA